MPEGRGLGSVFGRIKLDFSSFSAGRSKIQQEAALVKKAVDGIGESTEKSTGRSRDALGRWAKGYGDAAKKVTADTNQVKGALNALAGSFDRAAAAAKAFDNTPMGKINKGLNDAATAMRGVTLAASGLTGLGVKAAQDVKVLTTSIELLTGSADEAKQIMDDTRKLANQFNSPYLDLLQSAKAFLPLAKQNNIEMTDLQKLALKIKAVAPQKTFDEIKFSVSEALSGDFVSIKDAIDLTRKQRDGLKKALEDGGPQAVLSGITEILEARGFDDKMLEEFGASGANAFSVLRSEVQETMATAFLPLLQDVVLPLIKEFGNFIRGLREANPDILKFGAGFTALVAAGGVAVTVLGQVTAAWKALKVVAESTNLGGALGKVGKIAGVGLAVTGGALAGAGIAKGIADQDFKKIDHKNFAGIQGLDLSTGDLDRIKSKEKGGGGEDVGAVLGERLKQILVILVDQLLNFAGTLAKVALFVGNAIDQFVNVFRLGGAALGVIFGQLKETFGNLAIGLADALSGLFDTTSIREGGKATVKDARTQIDTSAAEGERLAKRLAEGFNVSQSDLDRVDANLKTLKDTVLGGMIDALFPVEEVVEETAEGITDAVDTINEVMGDSEEYLAQQAEDIASSVKKYNEEITALETEKQQAIIAINKKYADDAIQIANDRAKAEDAALRDLIRDRDKLNRDYQDDISKEDRDAAFKQLNQDIEFQRKERDAAVDHAAALVKIRKDAGKAEQEALLNLDFAKVFSLSEDTKSQIDEAQSGVDAQRAARAQSLTDETQDMARDFAHQRDERLNQFNIALRERSLAYQEQRSEIERQSQEKLAQAQTAHTADLQLAQQKYTSELQLRQQAIQQELQLLMMGEQQKNAFLLAEQQKFLAQAATLYKGSGKLAPSVQNAANFEQARPAIQAAAKTVQNTVSNILNSPAAQSLANFFGGRRAGGGIVSPGNAYAVNDLNFSGLMESVMAGGRSYPMPDGLGTFIPAKPAVVRAGGAGGSGATITQIYNLHEAHDLDAVQQLIREGNMDLLERLTQR